MPSFEASSHLSDSLRLTGSHRSLALLRANGPVFGPYFTLMQTHLNHRLVFRRLLLVNGAINPGCQAGWSGARTGERWKGNEPSGGKYLLAWGGRDSAGSPGWQ